MSRVLARGCLCAPRRPDLSVNGPWLNNQHSNQRNAPWFTYGKASDNRAPGPGMLWVLVDEDARGLNDAAFAFGMESPQWLDAPGTYHNGDCGLCVCGRTFRNPPLARSRRKTKRWSCHHRSSRPAGLELDAAADFSQMKFCKGS